MNSRLTTGRYGPWRGPRWRRRRALRGPLEYRLTGGGLYLRVEAKTGFETDNATVPWWMEWLFPKEGPWADPAALHDRLYRSRVERVLADAIFFCALKERGVPRWRRWAMYLGVRWLGKWYR